MKIRKLIPLLLLVLLFSIAARPMQETPNDYLQAIVNLFLSLAGVAAFFVLLINIGKKIGWVTDGNAAAVARWMNLIGLVVVGVLYFIAPTAIPVVDQILGLLAQLGGVLFPILALLFGWPVMNRVSKFTHDNVRGFPLLGYSHTKA